MCWCSLFLTSPARFTGGTRGRIHVIHVDRLWRYHGPEQYTWGHGEGSGTDAAEPDGEVLEDDGSSESAGPFALLPPIFTR